MLPKPAPLPSIPSSSNDSQFEPTGIRTVSVATADTDDAIYDLRGNRVNADALKPGIYIRKGKKIIR